MCNCISKKTDAYVTMHIQVYSNVDNNNNDIGNIIVIENGDVVVGRTIDVFLTINCTSAHLLCKALTSVCILPCLL